MDYLQLSDPEFTHLQMSQDEYLDWVNDADIDTSIDPDNLDFCDEGDDEF